MTPAEQLEALQTYFDVMSMNGGARVYHSAQEAGIFKALAHGPAKAAAVAESCGLKERPVSLLLDCLCGLRLLSCQDQTYALRPVMGFLAGQYRSLGDPYWAHLSAYLNTGAPIAAMDRAGTSEAAYQAQVSALDWMMRPSAEAAARMLGIGTRLKDLTILDVGAGSGVWSLTFLGHDPNARAVAVDWPAVLQIAEAKAREAGVYARFSVLPGNYHNVPLQDAAYDLAIAGNVSHLETSEGNRALFRRLCSALKPGGRIAVFDVMAERAKGGLEASLYALGLALRTEQGQVHSPKALRGFLEDAGFTGVKVSPIDTTPWIMGMVLGEKR